MVFSSTIFVFAFLPVTLLVYFLADRSGNMSLKNAVLFAFSLLFYAWGGLGHLFLLLALIVVNYAFGFWIGAAKRKKAALTAAVVTDLAVLGFFKYFNFFGDNLFGLLNILGIDAANTLPRVALPIGISYFTFQILSYLIDVYCGRVETQRNFIKLGLYIMLFPKLVAGPIVRYSDLSREIDSRKITPESLENGIKRFIVGFSKKLLLANALAKVADIAFAVPAGELPTAYAWFGSICYMLQLFFDFSAYSDMAIGLGWMFGFHFLENFRDPYVSLSIKDFWRRWHISLSTWFRDYLYIPLGGNKRGAAKTYRNLIIVFFSTGLWHGANWTFICWGLYHGAFSLLERRFPVIEKAPKPVRWLYTMFVVLIGWVLFRADTIKDAWEYIRSMFLFRAGGPSFSAFASVMNASTYAAIGLSVVACFPSIQNGFRKLNEKHPILTSVCCVFLFIVSLSYLVGEPFNPFIYLKF